MMSSWFLLRSCKIFLISARSAILIVEQQTCQLKSSYGLNRCRPWPCISIGYFSILPSVFVNRLIHAHSRARARARDRAVMKSRSPKLVVLSNDITGNISIGGQG